MSLPETATTGYRWEPDVNGDRLQVVETHPDAPSTPRGATGRRAITLEVLRPGPSQLRLVRKRSWEQQIAEQYTVEIDARDG